MKPTARKRWMSGRRERLRHARRPLRVEPLESRTVLSATLFPLAAVAPDFSIFDHPLHAVALHDNPSASPSAALANPVPVSGSSLGFKTAAMSDFASRSEAAPLAAEPLAASPQIAPVDHTIAYLPADGRFTDAVFGRVDPLRSSANDGLAVLEATAFSNRDLLAREDLPLPSALDTGQTAAFGASGFDPSAATSLSPAPLPMTDSAALFHAGMQNGGFVDSHDFTSHESDSPTAAPALFRGARSNMVGFFQGTFDKFDSPPPGDFIDLQVAAPVRHFMAFDLPLESAPTAPTMAVPVSFAANSQRTGSDVTVADAMRPGANVFLRELSVPDLSAPGARIADAPGVSSTAAWLTLPARDAGNAADAASASTSPLLAGAGAAAEGGFTELDSGAALAPRSAAGTPDASTAKPAWDAEWAAGTRPLGRELGNPNSAPEVGSVVAGANRSAAIPPRLIDPQDAAPVVDSDEGGTIELALADASAVQPPMAADADGGIASAGAREIRMRSGVGIYHAFEIATVAGPRVAEPVAATDDVTDLIAAPATPPTVHLAAASRSDSSSEHGGTLPMIAFASVLVAADCLHLEEKSARRVRPLPLRRARF